MKILGRIASCFIVGFFVLCWIIYGAQLGAFDHWLITPSADFMILWGFTAVFFAAVYGLGLAEREGRKIRGWSWIFLSLISFAVLRFLKNRLDVTPAEGWWFVTGFPMFFVVILQIDSLLLLWRGQHQGIGPGREGGESGGQRSPQLRRRSPQT